MPSKKSIAPTDYTPNPFPDPIEADLLDPEPTPRPSKKKNKHAKQVARTEPDTSEPEVARDTSTSPPALAHIPRSFPSRGRESGQDVLEELTATEKVSEDHTPPQENYLNRSSRYGQNPSAEVLPGFNYRPSPPAQNYLGRGGFNTRSPPTSPPLAKARPISYGGPPSTAGHSRNSSSPYAHAGSAFGSPPPHMPQAHFYEARDIDLGLGQRLGLKSQPATFVKFTKLQSLREARNATLVGTANQLDVIGYEGDKAFQIGSLQNLPGTVHDAVALTWTHGSDPYKALRPLVAVTVHGTFGTGNIQHERSLDERSRRGSNATAFGPASDTNAAFKTSVVVYSLREHCVVAELLHVLAPTVPQVPTWMDRSQPPSPAGRLKLRASGNHLTVSSGISGEIYVFGIRQTESEADFVCLDKLWTTLQPHMRRRESSHSRPQDQDVSPADIGRGQSDEEQAILSLNGRWLAYCPAISSRQSIGAFLGDTVQHTSTASITSRNPPARPAVTCAVDSPDVETMLGRVAKGVAQEMLKGGKWLGEKGTQYWQQYWNPDQASKTPTSQQSPIYSPQQGPSPFPPTHGDSSDSIREPQIVSILDLKSLQSKDGSKSGELSPLATFQPPGGCSFVSFTPNGLCLLTASRRGDIYYVWDLFQLRYPRLLISGQNDSEQFTAKVRQIHKNERFSESVIVDVEWESALGQRYAVLTQNRTIHMFDIPSAALRWPPPRVRRKQRPVSIPADASSTSTSAQPTSGFFASAMNFATTKTQPMLTNLRGRAPSMGGGGVSGIGSTGLGYASATGMRSGKVVAAGFSKSLGAATDTVASIRHAGQSKLHLKMDAVAGRLAWTYRDHRLRLSILEPTSIRNYYVRKTNPRERQPETVSVFDSRKAVNIKLPELFLAQETEEDVPKGFWNADHHRPSTATGIPAPLSFAEIETNAPYQPFHSDNRVTISIFQNPTDHALSESQFPTASTIFHPQSRPDRSGSTTKPTETSSSNEKWIFGLDIPTTRLNTGVSPERESYDNNERRDFGQRSVVYRETTTTTLRPVGEGAEGGEVEEQQQQIVSTTRRRKAGGQKKGRRGGGAGGDGRGGGNELDYGPEGEGDGFFEDDCDVLDFAEDRV